VKPPWKVFASWRGIPDPPLGSWAGPETCHEHASWPEARHDSLKTACLNGVRYVSVQDPNDVAVGEYDQVTNRWRQYPRALIDVEHTTKLTDHEGRAVVAQCTCGWLSLVHYGRMPGAADAALAEVEGRARAHELNPGEV
jgi:hypothetical protein